MAAIEYGTHYWYVILNGRDPKDPSESVHLHADDMKIDPDGTLVFRSAGRRQAGAEPQKVKQQKDREKGGGAEPQRDDKTDEEGKAIDTNEKREDSEMIYVAFAPGTWRAVCAAKLQDGYPASIEHWYAPASTGTSRAMPPNSGAAGYVARE